MIQITKTGGATVGTANVSWPLATLKVSKDKFEIDTFGLGTLTFTRNQIKSIDLHPGILSQGLKINHNVPNYETNVVFWTLGDAYALLGKIKAVGFLE